MATRQGKLAEVPHVPAPAAATPTVHELQRGTSVPIEALLTTLFVNRYTGIVTFDFSRGRPRFYSLGTPRRGNLVPTP